MSSLFFTPVLNPPLGSTSTRAFGTPIRFYAAMQVTTANTTVDPEARFTVLLWYSTDGRGAWMPAPFQEASIDTVKLFDVQESVLKDSTSPDITNGNPRRDLFVLDLEYDCDQGPLQFCLKYRFSDGPWLWAGSRIGGADGRVVFQDGSEPLSFCDLFEPTGIETTGWHAQLVDDQESSHSNRIWDTVWKGASSDSGVLELSMGRPKDLEQWMALVKIASPWMGPIHGTTSFATSKDALLMLYQRNSDGKHVAVLPISGLGGGSAYVTSDSKGRGEVIVRGMDDFETERKVQVIVAIGSDALETVASAVAHLKKLVMGSGGNGLKELLINARKSSGFKVREALFDDLKRWRAEVWQEWYQGCEPDFSEDTVRCNIVLELLSGYADQIVDGTMGIEEITKGLWPYAKNLGEEIKNRITKILGERADEWVGEVEKIKRVELAEDRSMWEDGVSYCTWNGLGWDLSSERIFGALEKLEKVGVKVCNLMIDDNWQSLAGRSYGSSGTWSSFEANEKFPGGLKGLVSNLRVRFPYLKHIGVWHALHGYWDGITPESTLGKEYKTIEVAWRDNVNSVDKMLTMIAPEDVGRFYDDFYRFLSECGIDSAKTDVQCRIDELVNGDDKGRLARAYQDAFKKSSIKYFDRRVIYCMAHVPQILYYALLPDDNRRVFFRTSDDFYPNVPQSHAWHIFANAMNMVLYGQLSILPDWDMFQSSLPTYNSLHAAARCLSGGPIFITDTPGEHDVGLINSMASPSPANRTSRALRPSKMAMAGDPYVAYHSNRLLQVRNTCGKGPGACLLLGVFNVSTVALTELVDMRTGFQDVEAGREYVIRAHNTGKVIGPIEILGNGEGDSLLVVGLKPSKWEMFTATPVETIQLKDMREIKIAALGIVENITGAVAVVGTRVSRGDEGKIRVEIDLCALGILVVYISDPSGIHAVKLGGNDILSGTCRTLGDRVATMEIDVLRAWETMVQKFEHLREDTITVSIELA